MARNNKLLAMILAVVMVFSMMPTMALAESTDAATGVAQVGGKIYDSLQDAIDEAAAGEEVVLLKSVELDKTLNINKRMVLNMDGKTISNSPTYTDTSKGLIEVTTPEDREVVEVLNGFIDSDIRGITVEKGQVDLINTSIESKKRGFYIRNAQGFIDERSSVSIKEGGNDAPVIIWGKGDYKQDPNVFNPGLEIRGTVDATKSIDTFAAVQGEGTDHSYPYMAILKTASLKARGAALYLPHAGETYIKGGTFEGESAVGIKSGKLYIDGGTFIGNGNYTENLESDSGKIHSDGSAINIDSNGGYAGEVEVFISETEDKVNMTSKNGHIIREVGAADDKTSVVSVFVEEGKFAAAAGKDCFNFREITKDKVNVWGGTYSSAPMEYIDENAGVVEDVGDGTYKVYQMSTNEDPEVGFTELYVGETFDIETTLGDANTVYSVFDEGDADAEPKGIIEVDEKGVVKALKPGSTYVLCEVIKDSKFSPEGVHILATFVVKEKPPTPPTPPGPSVPSTPEPEVVPPTVDAGGNIEATVKPDASGKVETTVPSETITESLDKVTQSPSEEKPVVEIVVKEEAGAKPADSVDVKVPADALDKVAKTEDATLKVTTSVGTVELDNDVLNKVAAEANGEVVTITVEKQDIAEITNEAQKETLAVLGEPDYVFDLTVKVGDRVIHQLGGKATFEIPYVLKKGELAENVKVYYIDNEGKKHKVKSTYNEETQKIVMITDHFSIFAVSYVDAPSKVKVLKATNEKGKAALRWSRATNKADGYRVYRAKTKDGKYSPIAWVKDGKAKTYKEKSKKTNKTYYYKVRAYKNVDGKKVWGEYSPVKKLKF